MERSANWFEVRDYIRPALEEADIPFLSADDALREHARDIACAMLHGEIAPRTGCHTLSRLAIELGYPSELMTWYALDDEYDLAAEGYVSGHGLNDRARRAAAALAPECVADRASSSPSQFDGKRGRLASFLRFIRLPWLKR
ncbi:MAG: hypothetical protein ABJF88_19700 [Rhodothermales bacterium]